MNRTLEAVGSSPLGRDEPLQLGPLRRSGWEEGQQGLGLDERRLSFVVINLDARQYGLESPGTKTIPPEIGIKVIDPFSSQEVLTGTCRFTFSVINGIEGGTIVLWNNKKSAQIQVDPVVGSLVIK